MEIISVHTHIKRGMVFEFLNIAIAKNSLKMPVEKFLQQEKRP